MVSNMARILRATSLPSRPAGSEQASLGAAVRLHLSQGQSVWSAGRGKQLRHVLPGKAVDRQLHARWTMGS